jgi:hypothetical protein
MNYKGLLIGLLAATLSITSLTSVKNASAFERSNDRSSDRVNLKSDSTNVTNNTVTPIDGQTEMRLMAKGGKGAKGAKADKKQEHTKNASQSNRQKHEEGQNAKKQAQINKEFKKAKKKNSNLSKDTFLRNRKN